MVLVSQGSDQWGPFVRSTRHPPGLHGMLSGTPCATSTAVGLLRKTGYGPSQCGAKEPCFQSLTTPNPWAQIHESVLQGEMTSFLVQT